MPKLKLGTIIPTPEENAAINAGIAADPDAFELDDEWFARARPAIEVDADLVENSARQQDQRKADAKENVTIPLDADILARLRESGPGWEDRLNETPAPSCARSVMWRRLTSDAEVGGHR